jgi:hypothetical protein
MGICVKLNRRHRAEGRCHETFPELEGQVIDIAEIASVACNIEKAGRLGCQHASMVRSARGLGALFFGNARGALN